MPLPAASASIDLEIRMSSDEQLETPTRLRTAAADLRRAGLGAIVAAAALLATPLGVFLGPLLGITWSEGAARFDPVTNASWTSGLFGLLELVQAVGIAFLVVGVGRALPSGLARDLGRLSGVVWVAGLTLHAGAFIVQNTAAQEATWRSISESVETRAMIGAAVTVVEWAFFAVSIFGALAWTVAFLVAGRAEGIARRGSAVPAVVIAGAAAALAAFGIIPPAATFAQIALWLVLGISLTRRSRALRY